MPAERAQAAQVLQIRAAAELLGLPAVAAATAVVLCERTYAGSAEPISVSL